MLIEVKQVDVVPVLELLPFFELWYETLRNTDAAPHPEASCIVLDPPVVQAPVESVCFEDPGHLQPQQREIDL